MTAKDQPSPHAESLAALRAALKIDHLDPSKLTGLTPTSHDLVKKITTHIQHEVSSYGGTSSGRRRALIMIAVEQAVDRFCAALENRQRQVTDVDRLFQQLGSGEAQDGHTLDAMRAAYHIAVRESWSHMHHLASTHAIPYELLPPLTQALFIYMQHLTKQVAIGFDATDECTSATGSSTARDQLVERLLNGQQGDAISTLADAARWNLSAQVVVMRVELDVSQRPRNLAALLRQIKRKTLLRDEIHSLTLIAKASDVQVATELLALPGSRRVARSWPVPVEQTRHAALWVRRALRLAANGQLEDIDVIDCAEHRSLLWLHADPVLVQQTASCLLEPLTHEPPHSRAVLAETLLLWLQTHASAPKLGQQLGVHEQTVRARMRRLKELFGEQLTDPPQALALLMAFGAQPPHPEGPAKRKHSYL